MWAALAITITALVTPVSETEQTVCTAPRASPGETVRGPVLHIPAADLMCVATGPDPSRWVPVPLAAPAESRSRLMSAAFGENAVCMINNDGRGLCRIEGDALSGDSSAPPPKRLLNGAKPPRIIEIRPRLGQ